MTIIGPLVGIIAIVGLFIYTVSLICKIYDQDNPWVK
jgi:hypothetical protein